MCWFCLDPLWELEESFCLMPGLFEDSQRCFCFLKSLFYSLLQGAHGLKGNEGPHGPPGPAVSILYSMSILTFSFS